MTIADIISIVATVALGLISLFLGIFAIWLALRFNDASIAALDSVKELAREIRTSVQIGLSQQTDLSTKMLDSIIEESRFGREIFRAPASSSNLENSLRDRLKEAERNIIVAVQASIDGIAGTGIKDRTVVDAELKPVLSSVQQLSAIVRTSLMDTLRDLQRWPAHYVLLAAIVRSGAHTPGELHRVEKKYAIPSGWERENGGLYGLLVRGLIQGTERLFEVPPNSKRILNDWLDSNKNTLDRLMEFYGRQPPSGEAPQVTEEERTIAMTLVFDEKDL